MQFKQALQRGFVAWLDEEQAKLAADVMDAALQAVEPQAVVGRNVQRSGERLMIGDVALNLDEFRQVKVVALGKAALAMTYGLLPALADRITEGLVVCKHLYPNAYSQIPKKIRVVQGNHPVPGEGSLAAGKLLADLLAGSDERDLVICLISGGGSALVSLPQAGVSLDDLQLLTRQLLACGAAIDEINCLRKHLDQIKGGGLAQMAAPARLVTLAISDVVGSSLDVIASGPTVADPTSFADALRVLEKYDLMGRVSKSVLVTLQAGCAGDLMETPKPGDEVVARTRTMLVADNDLAAQTAVEQARQKGFHAQLMTTSLTGEARETGVLLANLFRQLAANGEPLERPACLVFGGETTVTLHGKGLGGRNQELALSAAAVLAGLPDVMLASLGTDGEDGPTDAAGAFVTGQTFAAALEKGLSPDAFLTENDAYHFFAEIQGLIMTGPTGTNVNDLVFLFAF